MELLRESDEVVPPLQAVRMGLTQVVFELGIPRADGLSVRGLRAISQKSCCIFNELDPQFGGLKVTSLTKSDQTRSVRMRLSICCSAVVDRRRCFADAPNVFVGYAGVKRG